MTAIADATPGYDRRAAGSILVAGIVLATLTEAIASTVLSLGRNDIIGDTHATPDEFAWLDIGYTATKLVGFMAASWLMTRTSPRRLIIGSTLVMGTACGIAAITYRLDLLVALRIIQGFSGGALLVAGQSIIFLAYPRSCQPILQALFAMGSVVAPATIAPALQGWLIDSQSWAWIFFGVVPVALAAIGLLLIADGPRPVAAARLPFDWVGFLLISVTFFCFTYVLNQGSRWRWLEEPRIVWLTVIGAAALLAFLGQQAMAKSQGLFDFTLFRSSDFSFAFIVSFVAGAALFGSAYLIPSFAVSVLAFTPSEAGQLLLPSGALFVGALLIAAFLMQVRGAPPIATVPFGILMIMAAMWMLSGSTSESGADDMMAAILLRGFGLGFLFLSITLIAFSDLNNRNRASGIGLFNAGRQLGGLMGVAGLQTMIDHNVTTNATVLGASVTAGLPAVSERLGTTSAMLAARGMDSVAAGRTAMGLLGRALTGQSTVIAFDTAFAAIALLFVIAAPVLVTIKIAFALHAKKRAAQLARTEEPYMTYPASKPSRQANVVSRPDPRAEIVLAVSEALAHPSGAPADLDSILDRSGYSKEDILSAFESVDDLIVAIAEHKASLISQPLVRRARPGTVDDARETLIAFGRVAWEEYSTTLVGFVRMMMTEGARNPALKKRVHEAGQGIVTLKLREFLSAANERGILSISDAQLYAEQLLGLLREPLYQALMLTPAMSLEAPAADRVRASIESFIHGCGSTRSMKR
ncbi:DHA2 family efflux MFS transporter permease subunit [Bradyrhizobium sp. IC4060]|nr:DHA2 family efflux MFS transporter permease subunit [Bradyrhizobium sp. IC4060]MCA1485157.1 DHA2 family efflux MFS transporter permease subunit [Bradyrhizobium sp. IC4061]MCA1544042.1 DHA2 family efflux MFS transporter permease subunit [Bradyrhizobium sp. NBAIM32]